MRGVFVGLLLVLGGGSMFAGIISKSLYINKGEIMLVDSSYVPYLAFNESSVYNSRNTVLTVSDLTDTLRLKVYNTDTAKHGFEVKGMGLNIIPIDPGDSTLVDLKFSSEGAYIFYDNLTYPKYRYMGLGGMIKVKANAHESFNWNIKEHQSSWNEHLDSGGVVNWALYDPDFFTINGNSNPHINTDTTARITGNVGDTLLVYITNTGQSVHSLHFHGYHATILYSSKSILDVGRSKDTFAVLSMEAMVLEIVPDKPGEYPVHDHNLSAVSGGNFYPNGMFLTMDIK